MEFVSYELAADAWIKHAKSTQPVCYACGSWLTA